MSFPAAREAAIRELTGSDPVPRASNDLLAAEYIRTMLGNGSPMIPHAIPRTDARSATDLRQMLLTGRSGPDGLRKGLPEELWDKLTACAQAFSADCCKSMYNYITPQFGEDMAL